MKTILEMLEAGKTKEDVVSYLVVTDQYDTKTEARTEVEKVMADNGITATKKVSKAQVLKDAFLALEDPMAITKEELKKLVEDCGHTKGSVAYYVNAYQLAIDLTKKLS